MLHMLYIEYSLDSEMSHLVPRPGNEPGMLKTIDYAVVLLPQFIIELMPAFKTNIII